MTSKNQYGLSRNIPNSVQRQIRKRYGFGCVVCGSAIYEYEHVDPPFAKARIHDPSKMALLCGTHHLMVSKGLWSKDKVLAAMREPACIKQGFSFGAFDIGTTMPEIKIGNVIFRDTRTLLRFDGIPLFAIEPPETGGGPFRISAVFWDEMGQEILRIDRNRWISNAESWDVEIVGQHITFRTAPRQIALKLRVAPRKGIVVEQLNMFFRRYRLVARENRSTEIHSRRGAPIKLTGGITFEGCGVAIDIDEDLYYSFCSAT